MWLRWLAPGTEVLEVPTDITERGQCARLAAATVERFGRIDVLINSAYVTGTYDLAAEADLDDWRRTMDVNLFGTMNMIQAVVPRMKAQGRGSIVNVNTKVARMPMATLGGYAVSKAALRMATTQLAKELGGFGIRVMAHPWIFRRNPDVAVMVSGNAMAHLYLELDRRERPWWSSLRTRWQGVVDGLQCAHVRAALDPQPGFCCVRVRPKGEGVV